MLKYDKGDKVVVTSNSKSKHRFRIGSVVTICNKCNEGEKEEHYSAVGENGRTWYISESEVTEFIEHKSTKMDGWMVVDVTHINRPMFNLTEHEAKSVVQNFIDDGIDEEDIYVFAPNSNTTFRRGIQFND